jgi:hypothetical protein
MTNYRLRNGPKRLKVLNDRLPNGVLVGRVLTSQIVARDDRDTVETIVKVDRALAIASRARIRRRISSDSAAAPKQQTTSCEPPIGRDRLGRFAAGWRGGPGRPPRDALREAYVHDVFAVWKKHGRHAIRQLCQEDPRSYLRLVADLVGSKRRKGR